MKPTISARKHYDILAERGQGQKDPPILHSYMARWDGSQFYEMLGVMTGRDVLEVGIGTGRVAREVLKKGCRRLTGIDISPKTVAAVRNELAAFQNMELVNADICEFKRADSFDAAYSVLTFMHIEDKITALRNIVASLRSGGHVVLSIDREIDDLDFGEWKVPLFRWPPERYAEVLEQLGCRVLPLVPLIDTWIGPEGKLVTYGSQVATLIKGTNEKNYS